MKLTVRDRAIIMLLRQVAVLLGNGKEFDARAVAFLTMTDEQREVEFQKVKKDLRELGEKL
jgi:hypothetical protein